MNFSRGYDPVREKVSKGSKYTMSCYNCEYFYQETEMTVKCVRTKRYKI